MTKGPDLAKATLSEWLQEPLGCLALPSPDLASVRGVPPPKPLTFFVVVVVVGGRPKMGPRRAGSGLKRFLGAVGFVLAELQPKRSHGDPIRDMFRVNFQDTISRNILDEQHQFF